MNKIRPKLLSKEQEQEGAEKIKKLRELKKYGKKVQVEVQQKRQKEKKEMLEEMKKMRNMDNILDSNGKVGGGRKEQKRNFKDKKFGFGGKKIMMASLLNLIAFALSLLEVKCATLKYISHRH